MRSRKTRGRVTRKGRQAHPRISSTQVPTDVLSIHGSALGVGPDSDMPPTLADAHRILHDYFGFPSFRDGQERLVAAALAGRDALGTTISGATVTWATSSSSVATVSSAGLVTAVANGTATITATSGSASATATTTVSQVASSVTLSPTSLSFWGYSLGDHGVTR
jgi:hypothetical protein